MATVMLVMELEKTTNNEDGDGVLNAFDNCVDLPNGDQADADGDKTGDDCDDDQDNDGKTNLQDNCPLVANPGQEHVQRTYDVKARAVGDACMTDFDGDGVKDDDDTCPRVKHISKTSFLDYFTVDLYPGHAGPDPEWRVAKKGVDVEHASNTSHPGMLIDYIGVVFGYQTNRKFYVVMWRKENINYADGDINAGIKGLQLKLVDSDVGPGPALAKALWHSADTANRVTLLWCDPKMEGWQHKTPYQFYVKHRPSVGIIRIKVYQGEKVLTDSGDIFDTRITGGRLGMFVFGQEDVIWSRLEAKCAERVNEALQFDGTGDYVVLPSIGALRVTDSFTITTWIKMATNYPTTNQPIVCTLDATWCLYLKDRYIYGNIGSVVTAGTELVEPDEWHHLAFRYDAQKNIVHLFVNGTSVGTTSNVQPPAWTTLWGVQLPDSEIQSYLKLAGLQWPIHKNLVRAHYDMDEQTGSVLKDQSGNGHNGNLIGQPDFVPKNLVVVVSGNDDDVGGGKDDEDLGAGGGGGNDDDGDDVGSDVDVDVDEEDVGDDDVDGGDGDEDLGAGGGSGNDDGGGGDDDVVVGGGGNDDVDVDEKDLDNDNDIDLEDFSDT
ncbi:hypothetical protein QZH41_001242 [Actinostola sp. cb2023]|nr:hypothetical protein QZH41_001242 [Actinostola sp. cb2023]